MVRTLGTNCGSCVCYKCTGDLDLEARDTLIPLAEECASQGNREVIYDLRGVSFIDSSGLGALVRSYRILVEGGSELVLVITDENILRPFRITKMDTLLFTICESVEAARWYFQQRACAVA